jgi:UDP-glucose 4-epimerase
MRILVTGGCGFIGANLLRRLQGRADLHWRVFDDESLGRRERLGPFQGEFIRGDLRDAAAVRAAVEGMDAVIHLAADTRVIDSIANPVHNFSVNVQGGLNLLEAMRLCGVPRLINASTGGAILGEASPPVHEEMVARPLAPYGAGKLAMEGYCSAYAGSFGLSALSLRFSNVYGPGSETKGSVVAAFFKRLMAGKPLIIYGDGAQVRDFIYIDDLCDGIARALDSRLSGVVQLGSGRPVSIADLAQAITRAVAPHPVEIVHEPARPGEVEATWCDIAKARAVLGFDPGTPLESGLQQTWRWFLEHTPVTANSADGSIFANHT